MRPGSGGPEGWGGTRGGHHRSFGQKLFFGHSRGELDDDVQVTEVPGVLLEQVKQDPFQGGRVRAVPALARLPHLGQLVGLDDGPAAPGLFLQVG